MKKIPDGITPTHIIHHIIRKYESADYIVDNDYKDDGTDPLWPRFERAASNQFSAGEATLSRYAIWANTVRDNISEALREMHEGDKYKAHQLLIRTANSLSAFTQLQAYFDPFKDD